MNDMSQSLDQRITNLEIKLGFAEDLLDQLNQTVYRQQQAIERMAHLVAELRAQVTAQSSAQPGQSVGQEKPPHY